MPEDESSTQKQRALRDLFVEMTGEEGVTHRQVDRSRREVVQATDSEPAAGDVDALADADPTEDAADEPEPD